MSRSTLPSFRLPSYWPDAAEKQRSQVHGLTHWTRPNGNIPSGYPQPTPPLPQPFLGVWNAVSYASVTGAMGSWNDSPPCIAAELHCGKRYDELTQRLIDQNRLAVTFAANEFTNPEAVSCEFPPKRRLKHDNPVDTD